MLWMILCHRHHTRLRARTHARTLSRERGRGVGGWGGSSGSEGCFISYSNKTGIITIIPADADRRSRRSQL